MSGWTEYPRWTDAYALSTRAINAIRVEQVKSPEEVRARTTEQWMRVPGCGKTTLAELKRVFGRLGPERLPPSEQWWDFD